jgi:uncharacterized protein (DUF697 family)
VAYGAAAAVASFVMQPVPALDELVVVPLQYALCRRIGRVHGVPAGELPWNAVRKIIWYGAAARLVANFSLGLVPVVGLFANAVTAYALTEVLADYLEAALASPDEVDRDVTLDSLRKHLDEALRTFATQWSA